MKTIEFEDTGQDFTEWELDGNDIVVNSKPFQTEIWKGTKVVSAIPGKLAKVRYPGTGRTIFFRHKVKSVTEARDAG